MSKIKQIINEMPLQPDELKTLSAQVEGNISEVIGKTGLSHTTLYSAAGGKNIGFAAKVKIRFYLSELKTA